MKPFRLLALGAGAVVVLLLVAIGIAFSSTFQTWVARKAIAAQPDMHATIGNVSAGMQRVALQDLHFERGGAVLTLPSIEMDVPLVSAGWSKKVDVSRLVAKGWTLDLSKVTSAPAAAEQTPATSAAQAFAGIFTQLELPVDVSLDGVDLAGEVILPEGRGKASVTLTGGGLAAGHDGKFDLVAASALNDRDVNAVRLQAQLVAAMDSPRTFTRIALKLEASARGAKFPEGVKLNAEASAARDDSGEKYAVGVATERQEIANVKAELPRAGQALAGTWKLDIRDTDVAPFTLGERLPMFVAAGQGTFDTDRGFAAVHATGRLNTTTDQLGTIRAELAGLGELKLAAEFDLLEREGRIAVQKLDAHLAAAEPIAAVRALQPFELNPRTGELHVSDNARDAFGLTLHGVPVAWAKPFLKNIAVTGGRLRGEFTAAPRGGGVVLRSTAPLTVDGVSVAQDGQPLVRGVDFALQLSADYAPQGWQAEITHFTAKQENVTVLAAEIKAGQLSGSNQPIKATGKISANLPVALHQPAAAGLLRLADGTATAEFAASVGAKQEIQAKLELRDLAAPGETEPIKLPTLSADLRADVAPDGKITLWSPIVIARAERKSDLTLAGSLLPVKEKIRTIEANVTSTQLIVDDAKVFSALLPLKDANAPAAGTPSTTPDRAPPWAGFAGSIALQLKRVVYSDTFEVTELAGRMQIDAGTLKLEGLQAGVGDGGRANLHGTVTFDAAAPQPYALKAEMAVKEFDPGPLLRAMSDNQPPTVEGRFDIASKLAGHARTLGDLAAGADGDFQLTSKGGVFRGLPVNVGNAVENTSKIGSWLASAGTAITAMTGRKTGDEIASKVQALAELTKGLYPLTYDQLSVVVSRDAALNTTLRDFTLIAPEVRLTGGGTALHRPGLSLLEDPLAMEFRLRTRGRLGDVLKYLGAAESLPDDLGYAACTLPLRIGGTIGKPDTSELNKSLAALLLEKSGVTEKASELIDKLFGRTKG